jgi:uncharacterized glyoxalase superfamily protein PhnB
MGWIHEYPQYVTSTDIVATRSFYETHFKAEVILDLGWYLRICVAGCRHRLCFVAARDGATQRNRRGLTFPVEVADAERTFCVMRQQQLKIAAPLHDYVWGDRAFLLCDPNDLLLFIYSAGSLAPEVLASMRRYP